MTVLTEPVAGRRAPVAVALDAPDAVTAARWARAVAPYVEILKIGMELFYREGPEIIATLRGQGLLADPASAGVAGGVAAGVAGSFAAGIAGAVAADVAGAVAAGVSESVAAGSDASSASPAAAVVAAPGLFLDLKLHDIPATVAGGMRAVARLRPRFVTVHAAGGPAMVRAAVEAAAATAEEVGGPRVAVAGVTVLTSLGDADLAAIGLAGPALDAALRLAVLAVEAGATALVASPWEVARLRREVGNYVTLITPGVRPKGGDKGDQSRVATPQEALEAGADLVVMGRPITGSNNPAAVAAALAATLPRAHLAL